MTTLEIQRRLRALGFNPGPLDGVAGARTRRAVREFQERRGLEADGMVGPLTLAALGEGAVCTPHPNTFPQGGKARAAAPLPWMEVAEALRGVTERAGARNNPAILDWARDLDIAYAGDDIAWCGLFAAHCIGSTLPDEALPANPLGARNWQTFGIACPPQHGAVLVFWRTRKDGWLGHVGFYAGERGDAFQVLGGNQADSVSRAWIAKPRLLAARWPASAPFLATGRRQVAGAGDLSLNEA